MTMLASFVSGAVLLTALVVSCVFLLRERFLAYVARRAGVLEYGAERLVWGGVKRLRFVMQKGAVHSVTFDTVQIRLPAGRGVVGTALVVVRLLAGKALGGGGGGEERGSAGPLAIVSLQGVEVVLRAQPPAEPNGDTASRLNASGGDGSMGGSERGSGGGAASSGGTGVADGSRRAPAARPMALPGLLLALLPLVKLELKGCCVRASGSADQQGVGDGGGTTNGGDSDYTGVNGGRGAPAWEARLASLDLSAVRITKGSDAAAANNNTAESLSTWPPPPPSQGQAASPGVAPLAGLQAADDDGSGARAQGGGGGGGLPGGDSPAVRPSEPRLKLSVRFAGLEAVVRQPAAVLAAQGAGADGGPAAAVAAGGLPAVPLLRARCGGLSLTGTYGRGKSAGSSGGVLLAVAVDVKEVHVDGRTLDAVPPAAPNPAGCPGGDDAAGSPLAAALVAVAALLHARWSREGRRRRVKDRRRTTDGGEGYGGRGGALEQGAGVGRAGSKGGRDSKVPGGWAIAHGTAGGVAAVADKIAWLVDRLSVMLPEQISVRLGGVTASAALGVMRPATDSGFTAESKPSGPRPPASAAAGVVQFRLGPSILDLQSFGDGAGPDRAPRGTAGPSMVGSVTDDQTPGSTNRAEGQRAVPMVNASVKLGQIAVLASAGDAVTAVAAAGGGGGGGGAASTAPAYFAIQHMRVDAVVARSEVFAGQGGPAEEGRARYSLSAGIDLPASVLQLRPLALLPPPKLAPVGPIGSGTASPVAGPVVVDPRPQPHCYSLVLRGVSATADFGFNAACEAAVAAGPPPSQPPAAAGEERSKDVSMTHLWTTMAAGAKSEAEETGALVGKSLSAPLPVPRTSSFHRQLQLSRSLAAAAAGSITDAGRADAAAGATSAAPASGSITDATPRESLTAIGAASLDGTSQLDAGCATTGAPAAPSTATAALEVVGGGGGGASTFSEIAAAGPDAPLTSADSGTGARTPSPAGAAPHRAVPDVASALPGAAFTFIAPARAPEEASGAVEALASMYDSMAAAKALPPPPTPPSLTATILPPASKAGPGAYDTSTRSAYGAQIEVAPTVSLGIVLQGLDVYSSAAGPAASAAVTRGGAQSPLATAVAAGGRYDILVLQRTTVRAAGAVAGSGDALRPAATTSASGAGSHAASSVNAAATPTTACTAPLPMDAAVALGQLDVTLHPWALQPLLRLAAHAKGACGVVVKSLAATRRGDSEAAAPGRATEGEVGGCDGSGATPPGLPTMPFQFPFDMLGPAASGLVRSGGGSSASGDDGQAAGAAAARFGCGAPYDSQFGGGAPYDSQRHHACRRRRRRLLSDFLALRSLSIEAAAGVRASLRADMCLQAPFSVLPAEVPFVCTAFELSLGSLVAAAWPSAAAKGGDGVGGSGEGLAAVADTTVTDVTMTLHRVPVGTAAGASSASVSSTTAPQSQLSGYTDRQQVLRMQRLRVLIAVPPGGAGGRSGGTTGAGTATEPASSQDARHGAEGQGGGSGCGQGGGAESTRLLRFEFFGTRGSLDIDVALAALAAAQGIADTAAASLGESRTAAGVAKALFDSTAFAPAAVGGVWGGEGDEQRGGDRRHRRTARGTAKKDTSKLIVEVHASDSELKAALGAAEVLTLAVVEARGSTGLKAGTAEGVAIRVNDKRLLDVEYLAATAAAPLQPCPCPADANVGGSAEESVFTATAAAAGAAAAAASAAAVPAAGGTGSRATSPLVPRAGALGGSRHVSRVSADLASVAEAARQAPPPPPPQQGPGGQPRRHHRRYGSSGGAGAGSGTSAAATAMASPAHTPVRPAAAAAITTAAVVATALPPPPPPSGLRPWTSLGRPPAWAVGGTALGSGSDGPTAGLTGSGPGSKRAGAQKGGAHLKATSDARRRATRERFKLPAATGATVAEKPAAATPGTTAGAATAPQAGAPQGAAAGAAAAAARVASVDLTLYGTTLTVAYDESAARVYVVAELWSRAVKQVLAPRIAQLKQSLRGLRAGGKDMAPDVDAAPTSSLQQPVSATAKGGSSNGGHGGGHDDGGGDSGGGGNNADQEAGDGGKPRPRPLPPPRPDKPFIELLLDARRLAVVVEHQPLEAWLALHGAALMATAAQREMYLRVLASHVDKRWTAAATAPDVSAGGLPGPAGSSSYGVRGPARALYPGVRGLGRHGHSHSSLTRSASGTSSAGSEGSDDGELGESGEGGSGDRGAVGGGGVAAETAEAGWERGGEAYGGGGRESGWTQAMRDIAASYVAACRSVQSVAAVQYAAAGGGGGRVPGAAGGGGGGSALAGFPGGAILHLAAAEAQAAVVVAPAGCQRGREVAEAAIVQIDSPASDGVVFERVVAISLAAAASDVQVCLAGCGGPASPAAALGQVALSGWIIRARQLAAPPRCTTAQWPVGRFFAAPVDTPVRFCRPNMKTYTDLRIEADGVAATFITAMEPVLAQLAKALKQRVLPPQPQLLLPSGRVAVPQPPTLGHVDAKVTAPGSDGSAAASPSGLRPWDNIRYVWRGGMKVMIRGLNVAVGASSLELPITPNDPRVVLSAATLGLKLASGRVDVTSTSLTVVGHARGPGRGPGEPLLTVPLMWLPLLNTSLHTSFKQRSPTPYAFPLLPGPPPPGAVQEPVDVQGLMRSTSWSMSLEFSLLRDAAAHLRTAHQAHQGLPAPAAPLPRLPPQSPQQLPPAALQQQQQQAQQQVLLQQLQPGGGSSEGLPRLFIGELQVKMVLSLVSGLAGGAPVMTRGSWKRRTHYEPPRPRPALPTTTATAAATAATTAATTATTAASIVPGTQPSPNAELSAAGMSLVPAPSSATSPPPSGLGAAPFPASAGQGAVHGCPTRGPGPQGATGGTASLGALLSWVDINLAAEVFDITHDAQDPDDPSDLVCLRARNVRYANSFAYNKLVRSTFRSNGAVRSKVIARPVMTALSVEAYDIRIFMPSGSAAGSTAAPTTGAPLGAVAAGLGGAGAAASAAGMTRRRPWAAGGGARTAGMPTAHDPAGDTGEVSDPAAGPAFGAGLIGSCDCLLLRQAPPDGHASAGGTWPFGDRPLGQQQQQAQEPPPRPIRIVVQDVQVLCTADSRDAVIATTHHILQAFSRGPQTLTARQSVITTLGAAAGGGPCSALEAANAKGLQDGPTPSSGLTGGGPGAQLQAAGAGGSATMSTAMKTGGGGAGLDGSGQGARGISGDSTRHQVSGALKPPYMPYRTDLDPLAEPQIDPRVIADERALVAQLRQQNEARRAEARRRHLDRTSGSTTSTGAAASGADAERGGLVDSESEDEAVLGHLDPSDAPDGGGGEEDEDERDAALPPGAVPTAAGSERGAAAGQLGQQTQMQYEVEFVRVQVGLIADFGGGNACMVLAADNAVLRGGRSAAAANKVLTFNVETLQAYAARQEQPRESALASSLPGGAGTGVVRTSFSPLADGLAATAAAAAASSAAAAGLPPRPGAGPSVTAGPAAAAMMAPEASAGGGVGSGFSQSPVVWLQCVNGQLVPYGNPPTPRPAVPASQDGGPAESLSGSAAAAAATVSASDLSATNLGPTGEARAPIPGPPTTAPRERVIMQKILNPFRIQLTSSRPWVPPPDLAQASGQQTPPQGAGHKPDGGVRGVVGAGAGAVAGSIASADDSNKGLKLDIDVPAITGQMESWQFQLLMTVIQETVVSPLPKVLLLTRESGPPPLPAVETSEDVMEIVDKLSVIRRGLRCLQHEAASLATHLTHGAFGGPAFAGGPYTADLFKPPQPAVPQGGSRGAGGAVAGSGGSSDQVSVLAHALMAPRQPGLTAVQQTAILRRNQELLLHWIREQVAGAQDAAEATAGQLVRKRNEVAAVMEARQHQRRKQATAVAVRLGRFGWVLTNREGGPFVQAELKGLSFHHSLDRDHTGTTKIVMHAADMWQLRPDRPGQASAPGATAASSSASSSAAVPPSGGQLGPMQAPAPASSGAMPPPPTAAMAAASSGSAGVVAGPASTGGERGTRGGGGGGGGSNTILSLWRPDASTSWDDDPLLRMYVVHGGVDAQCVTYEHIEVYLHPLQVRLTYALAHALMDYFGLRDEGREEAGGGREEEGAAAAAGSGKSKRDKSKGSTSGASAAVTAAPISAAGTAAGAGSAPAAATTAGGGSAYTSPAKSSRSGGGGLFSRRVAAPAAEAAGSHPAAQVAHPGPGTVPASSSAGGGVGGAQLAQDPRMQNRSAAAAADFLEGAFATSAAGHRGNPPSLAASPQRGHVGTISQQPDPATVVGAAAAVFGVQPPPYGRHSRTPSYADDVAPVPGIGGAAVAMAFAPSAMVAVRYGPTYRRRADGGTAILVEVAGALVPTVLTASSSSVPSSAPAGGRGGRGSTATQGAADAGGGGASPGAGLHGAGGRSRRVRRLLFRHVRFNRIAARLTYSGPRLSLGGSSGLGIMIDPRVYRNIVGGWRDILAKYKWDVIRSVIKSVAGIQSSKLKELRGGPRGTGAAAAAVAAGDVARDSAAAFLAAGLSLEELNLDPEIAFTADGNSLAASVAGSGSTGGGSGLASGSQRAAAALIGGVKKRAAAFMSAGGAASARLRQAATGRTGGRTTEGGVLQPSAQGSSYGLETGPLAPNQEEGELDGDDAATEEGASLASADAVRQMVRQDTAQQYERIMRAAAQAQARATRLVALLGDVPSAGTGGGSISGLASTSGARGRTYRA